MGLIPGEKLDPGHSGEIWWEVEIGVTPVRAREGEQHKEKLFENNKLLQKGFSAASQPSFIAVWNGKYILNNVTRVAHRRYQNILTPKNNIFWYPKPWLKITTKYATNLLHPIPKKKEVAATNSNYKHCSIDLLRDWMFHFIQVCPCRSFIRKGDV